VTKQQLNDAITLLQKLIPGAQIIYKNETYQGETETFDIGIKCLGLPNGMGFSVCDGKVYIHGDEYQQQQMFNRIKSLVEKGDIFIASKMNQNAKAARHQVKTELTVDDEIKVEVYA
jgi:hypothetical protein